MKCIMERRRGSYSATARAAAHAAGAAANRVALEASVKARNEGRDLAREGGDVIRAACKWSPELAAACEVWKEIKFEFETIDKL